MTAKPSLKRSATLNLIGGVLPMLIALLTTPLYLHHIGTARYGVLAIVWMVQGYFGFLDLGLSPATSNRIAQLSEAPHEERESVFWTALILNTGLGIAGGATLFVLMHVVLAYFDIGKNLSAELAPVLAYVACLVPLSNLISVFTGALTGRERFGTLNAVQLPVTLMYQLMPLGAALLFGPSLRHLVLGTFSAGAAALALNAVVVWRVFPLRFSAPPSRACAGQLFSYGAWISVTNLTIPLLETADRMMIGNVLGPQAVAYYQVPFNLAARVRVLPQTVTRTVFPRLSALDAAGAVELSFNAIRGLAAALTPMTVFGVFLMHPFLSLWVGQEFAYRATSVGETILVGIWISAFSAVAICHIQAVGRPGVAARYQAYEIIPFFALLWWALHAFGVFGAALAWSARCLLDGALLLHAARIGEGRASVTRMLVTPGLIVGIAYGSTLLFAPLTWPCIAAWVVMTAVALAWSARMQPQAFARALHVLAALRGHTRRGMQGEGARGASR
ncbi:flippase [Paraburkholderia sp. EG285A]|uniref:flippase n=1 Tax=Paraburkholderia sp. EG285A TaxID=3237009 RepID=UPI0034D1C8C7